MKRFLLKLSLSSLAIALFASVTLHHAQSRIIDGVAVNVAGHVIAISELDTKMKELGAPEKARLEVLNRMIDEYLVDEEIKLRGLNAKANEVEAAIQQIRKQNRIRSDEQLLEMLRRQGLTEKKFRENLTEQLEKSKFVSNVLGARIEVRESDIKAVYRKRYLREGGANEYKIRDLFLPARRGNKDERQEVREKINKIRQDLVKKKIGFATAAKKHSKSPSAKNGGLLGTFSRQDLRREFIDEIEFTKKGEVTEIVAVENGFYLFLVEDITQGSPPPLESVAGRIREELRIKEADRQLRLWIDEKRRGMFIDIRIPEAKATAKKEAT